MMTIAYEPLDTPVGKDQCAVSMEEPFFKPIWKTLLRLFRYVLISRLSGPLISIFWKLNVIHPVNIKHFSERRYRSVHNGLASYVKSVVR